MLNVFFAIKTIHKNVSLFFRIKYVLTEIDP